MEFLGSPEQAGKLAGQAMARMAELGIPPNPNNFAVWFHYFSGRYPDLRKTIDVLIDNGQEFDEERCTDLFVKFFTFGIEGVVLNDTTSRLEAELAKVIEMLGVSRQGTSNYGKTLEAVSERIGAPPEGDNRVQTLLQSVISATRVMERQNQELEAKLRDSTDEVSRLQTDLEDMRREAMTDSLTGLANRKVFDSAIRRAAMDAMENGTPLSLLMLDIDHFKRFNDTFGHQVGDQVLRLLAHTLTKSIKGRDTAARYGGEEFGVILPGTSMDDAITVAEQIRKNVAGRKVVNRTTGEDMGQITISVGVGTLELGEPVAQFISRTDQALYEAKGQGRNRVITQQAISQKDLAFEKS